MRSLSFTYQGQAPSKSNFRWAGPDRWRKWKRIKDFQDEIGQLAWLELVSSLIVSPAKALNEWSPPHVTIHAHKQRIDTEGANKAVLDSMIGVLYVDDKNVGVTAIPRPDGPARLVITVEWEDA